jgi:hypothetical protein
VQEITHGVRTKVLVQPEQTFIRPGSGGALIPLSKAGSTNLAKFTGVPNKLVEGLGAGLWSQVANHLLMQKGRYTVLFDGNEEVVDFAEFRGGVGYLAVERVLAAVEKGIPRGVEWNRVEILDGHTAVLEVLGARQENVRRGDLVRAGAMVKFSPTGMILPTVQSYVLRLVCTNGQTSRLVLSNFTGGGGEGDNVWQWFRQSVRAAYDSVGDLMNRYREMINDRIPANHRAEVLEALLRNAGIKGKEAEAVRAQALANPPRNSYDMMNLITWASSHIVQTPARRQRIMSASSEFIDEADHTQVCPLCNTITRQRAQAASN